MFPEPVEPEAAPIETLTTTSLGSDNNNNNNNNDDDEKKKNNDDKKKKKNEAKDKKYRRRVRDAYTASQETIRDALGDRSLDIYQYCAFLSTNSYHVAPKSVTGQQQQQQQNGDGDNSPNADGGGDNSPNGDDFIDHAVTSLGSGSDFNERVSQKKRESTNRFSMFTTDSLRKAVPRKYRVTKAMYYWSIVKALLVLGLQLTAVIVAMSDLLDEYDINTDSTLCSDRFQFENTYQGVRKVLFAGFCAFLALSITNIIHDLRFSAFYSCLFDNQCLFPDLVDNGWLVAGRTINYVVLIIITWSSFLIIFFSNRVLDMVVNSAAIFFVLQLDNMVIGTEQREVVGHYLAVYKWELDQRTDAFIRKKKNLVSEIEKAEENKRKEWNVVKIFFDLISWLLSTAIVTPAVYLTSFLAFIFVPTFMLVCA